MFKNVQPQVLIASNVRSGKLSRGGKSSTHERARQGKFAAKGTYETAGNMAPFMV